MKFGMSEGGFPADTLGDSFACIAAAGYDGVEIKLTEDRLADPGRLVRIQELADDHGLTIPTVIANAGQGAPLGDPDETVRTTRVETATALIEEAVSTFTDLETILVVPGGVSDEIPYDTAYEQANRSIETIGHTAERHDVTLGIENVWNNFLLSPIEFAQFIDEAGGDPVGAYFDVGNIMQYGFPQQWIDILGDRVRKVHVKDFKSDIGNTRGFTYPTQGDVPWDEVSAALDDIGYDGWITVEVSPYPTNPRDMPGQVLTNLEHVFS